jgi:autotransporter-associated beta strand protein
MSMLSRVRILFGFVGSLALGLALGSPALVGQTTWGGTGSTTSTGVWTLDTNWSNGKPTSGKSAVFDGQGPTTITGASGLFGGMTFSAGSYTITLSSKFTPSSGISVAAGTQTFNGGSIALIGNSQTWSVAAGAALNVSTSVNFTSTSALTLDGAGNFDLSGSIAGGPSGSTAFTKNGSGTAILRGAINNLQSSMTVSDGTLLINGEFSSPTGTVTVNGGTLGGTGTMTKATTINAGGTLAPGASPGVLTFGRALTLATGSTTAFELNGTTRGTDYDGINLTSTTSLLTYGGLLSLNFGATFLEGADLNLFDLPTTGVGAIPAGSFDMITGVGNYAGSFTNTGGGTWTMTSGGQLLTFTESTGNLTISAVPEPATAVALAGAAALAIVAWRRGRGRRTPCEEARKRS